MPLSSSTRQPVTRLPAWVHPARSVRAFWTPAVIVLTVAAALVLCWPRGERRGTGGTPAMPEPAAAYVLLDGAKSYGLSPVEFGVTSHGFEKPIVRLEDLDRTPQRQLPPPVYSDDTRIRAWEPTVQGQGSNVAPDLADWPVASSLVLGLPAATNSVVVSLSPGLQHCAFAFDVPFQVSTTAPATASFHVEVDDAGRVVHLLSEPSENPRSARLVEAAINMGHGAHAGRGEVQVSWGR